MLKAQNEASRQSLKNETFWRQTSLYAFSFVFETFFSQILIINFLVTFSNYLQSNFEEICSSENASEKR